MMWLLAVGAVPEDLLHHVTTCGGLDLATLALAGFWAGFWLRGVLTRLRPFE